MKADKVKKDTKEELLGEALVLPTSDNPDILEDKPELLGRARVPETVFAAEAGAEREYS
ncbi:MAG: hypothetical protein FWD72_06750 [Eggerthellaceae bacterium]|nr:hypothetical protein [Eggerthellaceae bacterium]